MLRNDINNHGSAYYDIDDKRGFNEQFANYMVLKTYPKEYEKEIAFLRSLIGDEWFNMMDEKYHSVANKISLQEGKIR